MRQGIALASRAYIVSYVIFILVPFVNSTYMYGFFLNCFVSQVQEQAIIENNPSLPRAVAHRVDASLMPNPIKTAAMLQPVQLMILCNKATVTSCSIRSHVQKNQSLQTKTSQKRHFAVTQQ